MTEENQIDLLHGLSPEEVGKIFLDLNDSNRIASQELFECVNKALRNNENIQFRYDPRYLGGIIRISIGGNLYPRQGGAICRLRDIMPYVLRYRRNKSISELL